MAVLVLLLACCLREGVCEMGLLDKTRASSYSSMRSYAHVCKTGWCTWGGGGGEVVVHD